MTEEKTPILEVRDLKVEIETADGTAHILKGVDFALDAGDTLGFVGESGCGKSMTALAVMGLLPDQARVSGEVLFNGRNLLAISEADMCKIRGRRIVMVFQEPMSALNPVKTIGFQIAEGMRLHLGLSRGEAEGRTIKLLDRVGLPAPRFTPALYPHQLSGGQRQRVIIAMAMACGPDILIADEPTTALDVTIQARILDLIADVVEDAGMTLIMITHDLGVVAQTTRRLAVMYAGAMVETGTTRDVFARTAHPYTRGLFAAMPGAAETAGIITGKPLAAIPGEVPAATDIITGCAFAARCSRVSDICRTRPAASTEITPGHSIACHNPATGAP